MHVFSCLFEYYTQFENNSVLHNIDLRESGLY